MAACITLKNTSVLSYVPINNLDPRPIAERGMSPAVCAAEVPSMWPVMVNPLASRAKGLAGSKDLMLA